MDSTFGVWTLVKDRLPKGKKQVIVCCRTDRGFRFITTAEYIPSRTVLAENYLDEDCRSFSGDEPDEYALDEYNEKEDVFWVKEGWFECTNEWEYHHHISDQVYAWMPLPEFPEEGDATSCG